MIILSIDPGPATSGVVRYDSIARRVLFAASAMDNHGLLKIVHDDNGPCLAVEIMENQGRKQVGSSTFDTMRWVGRFQQAWHSPEQVRLVGRRQEKRALGLKAGAKDSDVRRALIAQIGPVGTKSEPGPCYGVAGHAWSALAVAVAC